MHQQNLNLNEFVSILTLTLLLFLAGSAQANESLDPPVHIHSQLQWDRLPDLPDSIGVAGPFTGVHNDALIVAGGANFPDGVPWHPTADGGKSLKRYHRRIHVLIKTKEGAYRWVTTDQELPQSIAYGTTIPTQQGLLCLGGQWQEHNVHPETGEVQSAAHLSNDVFLLQWNPVIQTVEVTRQWKVGSQTLPLPQLPRATTSACGAIIGNYVYFASGNSGKKEHHQFLRLHLVKFLQSQDKVWEWEELPAWDGPARNCAIGVGQAGTFFLVSGRNHREGNRIQLLTDMYRFDPAVYEQNLKQESPPIKTWKRLADIALEDELPRCVMAGTGAEFGENQILIFGGARGDIFLQREQVLPRQIAKAQEQSNFDDVAKLEKQANVLYDDHQGFSSDVLQYNITEDTWIKHSTMPMTSPVTTTAVRWGEQIVIPSGEKYPGVRTDEIWRITTQKSTNDSETTDSSH